ncbi:acylphosphatase, partial [Kineococcus esterisolvens]|uniref:acylphosphatase n=1 Tax=Kineococcus sp. SYSU DK025 TaxID=3383146 RepID=UPI003D7CDD55
MDDAPAERLTAFVSGAVQGVGFRWWTRSQALQLGLAGRAVNKPDGRVEVVAEGGRPALEQLLDRGGGAPGGRGRRRPRSAHHQPSWEPRGVCGLNT